MNNHTDARDECGDPILNWIPIKKNYAGLKEAMQECLVAHIPQFRTLRLGSKWADALNPGQRVAISISESPEVPEIIGHAIVLGTRKGIIELLERGKESLELNIGAKTWKKVLEDMREVYNGVHGKPMVSRASTVSIIDLLAEKELSTADRRLFAKVRKAPHSESPVFVTAGGEELA